MENSFNNLATVKFNNIMTPIARSLYKSIFPGCDIKPLKSSGTLANVLDSEYGIDSYIVFPDGSWISLQEKYRSFDIHEWCIKTQGYLDFTQEYKNAYNTEYEARGEWFKLGAQLYFYGWANEKLTAFHKWVIIDIARYKLIVKEKGGLDKIGNFKQNNKHGKTSFYAIPIEKISDSFLYTSINIDKSF